MEHMSVKVYNKNFFAIVISMVHDAKIVYFKGRIIIYASWLIICIIRKLNFLPIIHTQCVDLRTISKTAIVQ